MSDIAKDVLDAQRDRNRLNQLISDYLPFIKKQLSGLNGLRLEYDDMLSLAMLTFSGCVHQYSLEKGNFLAFCSVCIRNRLLDESRKQVRYERTVIPLFDSEEEDRFCEAVGDASVSAYNTQQEQLSLAQEIECFSGELKKFGIDFSDLPRVCPKQVRSRELCSKLAREIVTTPLLYHEFLSTQRVAQRELSAHFDISPKTVEKHRKYIVTLIVLMSGDYPYIRAFLPNMREVM